jgi:hypothetical protein
VLIRVERHLVAGGVTNSQAAIDLIVGVLAARGEIDLKLLDGRKMTFDPKVTDEGHTRQWGRAAKGG